MLLLELAQLFDRRLNQGLGHSTAAKLFQSQRNGGLHIRLVSRVVTQREMK